MQEAPEQTDSMFPKLDDAQIARLAEFGQQRSSRSGKSCSTRGTRAMASSLCWTAASKSSALAADEPVSDPGARAMFTGEVNQLSGRRSLVRCRAREASSILEIGRANLRRVIQTDATLGEILLRAFLLRRVYLIANSVGDAVLIGSSHSADTLRLARHFCRATAIRTPMSMWSAIPTRQADSRSIRDSVSRTSRC